jgi:hypothetical protein
VEEAAFAEERGPHPAVTDNTNDALLTLTEAPPKGPIATIGSSKELKTVPGSLLRQDGCSVAGEHPHLLRNTCGYALANKGHFRARQQMV